MIPNKYSERFEKFISKQIFLGKSLGELLVFVLIIIYIFIFSYYSILRHLAFKTFGFDLGVYNQALYTTLKGKFFYESPDLFWNPGGSFFGVHFAPLLYLLLPIYAINPHPVTLLLIQTFILGVGALPVYWLAKRELGSENFALTLAGMYLLNPGIHAVNVYDFHLEAFLPAFFLFAYYFFITRKWIKYFFFVTLVTITIDYANLLLVSFGIYLSIQNREIILKNLGRLSSLFSKNMEKKVSTRGKDDYIPLIISVTTIILGITMFVIAFTMISMYGPKPLTGLHAWPNLGTSVSEIIFNLVNPSRLMAALSFDWYNKVIYFILLFSTTAFLPILSPYSLIMTVPWFAISLFSVRNLFFQLGWHYPANVIPFLMIGSVYGVKKIKKVSISYKGVLVNMLLIIIFVSIALSPLNPIARESFPGASYERFEINEHTKLLNKIIKFVPRNSSILTQNDIFPHLSGRTEVYLSAVPKLPEYVLIDVQLPTIHQSYGGKKFIDIILDTIKKADYGVIASADGILLLKQNYHEEPQLYIPITNNFNYNNLIPSEDSSVIEEYDPTSKSGYVFSHEENDVRLSLFWHGPYTTLPQGTYEVTYVLKISGNIKPENRIITLDVVADKGRLEFSKKIIYGLDIPLTGSWFNITVPFSLKHLKSDIEFRGRDVNSNAKVVLDCVIVKQISRDVINIVNYKFDHTNLIPEKGRVIDGVLVHGHNMGAGTFWFGPYTKLPSGNYLLELYLRLDNASTEHILDLDLVYNKSRTVIDKFVLFRDNFTIGKWQKISFIMNLNETVSDLEIRGIYVEDNVDLSLLYIEIESLVKDNQNSPNCKYCFDSRVRRFLGGFKAIEMV